MFKTSVGPVDDGSSFAYLRPETAQQIFTNFKNVLDSTPHHLAIWYCTDWQGL